MLAKTPKFTIVNALIVILVILFSLFELVLYFESKNLLFFPDKLLEFFGLIVVIMATFLIVSIIVRLTASKVFNLFHSLELESRHFLTNLYTLTLYAIGLIFIFYKVGVSLDNITLVLGFLATGLAFAVRDILLSFIAWIVIGTKKLFGIKDYIKIGEDEGVVTDIGTFFTVLNGSKLTKIPNKIFLEKPVIILGKESITETFSIKLGKIPDLEDLPKVPGEVYLDSNTEGVYLKIKYSANLSDRKKVKSKIIQSLKKYL